MIETTHQEKSRPEGGERGAKEMERVKLWMAKLVDAFMDWEWEFREKHPNLPIIISIISLVLVLAKIFLCDKPL